MNSHEDQRWRRKRRADWIEANRARKHPDTEAERLIEFASVWAPYGGATEEEILVQFGMTRRRFIARLRQVIPESKCAYEEFRVLSNVYPKRTANERFVSRSESSSGT